MEFLIFIIIVFILYVIENQPAPPTSKPPTSPRVKPISKPPTSPGVKPISDIGKIKQSIDAGEAISFDYIDSDGVITKRSISPHKSYWGNSHRNDPIKTIRTYYIEGYCHLRNQNRTFILERMSKIEIG